MCCICFVFWEEDLFFLQRTIDDNRFCLNNLFLFSISALDYLAYSRSPIDNNNNTGVLHKYFHTRGICVRMPLGGLIPTRSKTDHAKQLKEFFTVIETENDKERKNYEEVNQGFLV